LHVPHGDTPYANLTCPLLKISSTAIICLALILSSPAVVAQAVDSGALLRQQQQAKPQPPPPTEAAPLTIAPPAPEAPPPESAGKVFVTGFELSAPSSLITNAELTSILKEYTGREENFAELERATAKVAEVLRKRGYPFASVRIPQQEVAGGVIALEVVPGKMATGSDGQPDIRVKADGRTRLNAQRAAATVAAPLTDPVALNTLELERGLLLLNDLPGVQGTGTVVSGQEPGTLALELTVKEDPLFGGWADVDDYGSRTTGSDRVAADLHLNDLSGRGDVGEVYLAKSSGTESTTASYTDPIGVTGLSTHLSASYMRYHLLREFSPLDATGDSTWLSGGVSYPILRSRSNNLYWTASADYKRLIDQAAGENIDSRDSKAGTLGVHGDHLLADEKSSLVYLATLTGGNLDRGGNAADNKEDLLTRHTQGDYAILRSTDSWLQQFNQQFSLFAELQMQFASRNLDSSEKMYMGGPHGVRAYPIEEAGSDDGQTLSVEARYIALNTPMGGGEIWTPFVLFDAGHAMLNKSTWNGWNQSNPALKNSYSLKGWGVGVRAQIARIVQLELVDARKIGDNPGASATGRDADGLEKTNRVWFIASVAF
jgi:hemolysin activation/secretion protein